MITTVGNPSRRVFNAPQDEKEFTLTSRLCSRLKGQLACLAAVALAKAGSKGRIKKYPIFLLLLLFSSFTLPATINLKLTTLEGATLEQAGVGQPFLLNVVVTNAGNSAQYPTLKGIDNLHVRQSGFQMNMVNGATSVTYHYRVRIDTPGNYTLGPATIVEGTETIQSSPITVTVGDIQKSTGNRAQRAAPAAPIMKLVCDNTQVYVGQKINVELSFYTPDPTTVLQTIIEPENSASSGLVIKNKQTQPITGTEKINGIEYRFAKWNFQITSTKAGSLVVPAYAAQYTSQANAPMLAFFFHNDAKRVYSNTVALQVKALPHSLRAPEFVGTINKISAQAHPTNARVGEGIVYAISVAGEGDFETLGMLQLNMSQKCKWYESKKTYDSGTYTMEYIVQALEPGTITIPAQELFYFDTASQRYKTSATNPITITAFGSSITANNSTNEISTTVDAPASINPLAPINQNGPIEHIPPSFIPWYIFWAFIGSLMALWLLFVAFTSKKDLCTTLIKKFINNESAYTIARKRIKNAYAQKNYAAYYRIINQLFAARLNANPAQLSPEIIENSLIQDGLSSSALQDWRNFYAELCQFSFYKENLDQTYYQELTQKIVYWIDVLEKLPRVTL